MHAGRTQVCRSGDSKSLARTISYKHPDSKGRQWLLTSLTDANTYLAAELALLYHERWELELGRGEIKTHLLERQETIRSRTVEGVQQEIWGILLMYNLIQGEMVRIAEEAGVTPNRISFVAAMRYIRAEWGWCAVASPGTIPKKLLRLRQRVARFVLPPRRSNRRYPRRQSEDPIQRLRQEAATPNDRQIAQQAIQEPTTRLN